jgi:uncharacterized membrane protein YoaK (UPF0700 family)
VREPPPARPRAQPILHPRATALPPAWGAAPTGPSAILVAQAHSFAQQARLAVTLAWVAGYTNILTLLTCAVVTSHVSGSASNLGFDLANGSWRLAAYAAFLLLTFFSGAVLSGLTTELGRRRAWESIYVLPMTIEAALLAAFALGVHLHDHNVPETGPALYWMTGAASLAMGLQNATITRISSGVVRTTHMTGILTDLGLESVQLLWWVSDRRRNFPPGKPGALAHSLHVHPTAQRLALLAGIFALFCLGAFLGTLAYSAIPTWAMAPPVLFLCWIIFQDIVRPIAEIESSELLGASAGLGLPETLAVYHLRKDQRRRGKVQRMPNLTLWAERLPPGAAVVVLDLADITRLDGNAAVELRAALHHLARTGRRLIIAGLSGEQFEQLRRTGVGELLDPMNVCPDLELAVARALSILMEHHPTPRTPEPAHALR